MPANVPNPSFAERAWAGGLHVIEMFVAWLATSGVRILLILLMTWAAVAVIRASMRRIRSLFAGGHGDSERVKRADTLTGVLSTIAFVLLLVVSSMMILNEIGIAIGPILATAGLGGLAIGFGAQSLVKDVISGFFLLVEDQVRVGDTVDIGGKSGVVEAISLRTIRLRDLNGTLHVIPNGNVSVVSNLTKDYSRYVFNVTVPGDVEPSKVFTALRELGEEIRGDREIGSDVLGPVEVLDVDYAGGKLVVRARIPTQPSKQWEVGRELSMRLRQRFPERGIQLQ
jgi:small conductance mechanosensitive channel